MMEARSIVITPHTSGAVMWLLIFCLQGLSPATKSQGMVYSAPGITDRSRPLVEDKDCTTTRKGHSYDGYTNTTLTGRICQRWDQDTPQAHGTQSDPSVFPSDDTLAEAANYCRGPTDAQSAPTPWCLTMDVGQWQEMCNIPRCIDVPENLAFGGATWSSDGLLGQTRSSTGAWLAVDGWDLTNYNKYMCLKTNPVGSIPWMAVDLRDVTDIDYVTVLRPYNPCDTCSGDILIAVSNTEPRGTPDPTALTNCGQGRDDGNPPDPNYVVCYDSPLRGRYLYAYLENIGNILTICELSVYAMKEIPVYLTYYYDSSTFNCDHYFVRRRPVHDVQYVLNDNNFTTCISLFQGGENTFFAWGRTHERRQFDVFLIGANLHCSPIDMDVFTETSTGNIIHCKASPAFVPRNGLSTCRYRCSCYPMCSNMVSFSLKSHGKNKTDWTICEWITV